MSKFKGRAIRTEYHQYHVDNAETLAAREKLEKSEAYRIYMSECLTIWEKAYQQDVKRQNKLSKLQAERSGAWH